MLPRVRIAHSEFSLKRGPFTPPSFFFLILSLSATERVQKGLDSDPPDWSTVSLKDIRYCINAKIGRFRKLRRYRDQPEGRSETQSIADDLKRLFPALAQKHAQRGPGNLEDAIKDLEETMAELDRINPFDDVYLTALRSQREKHES